MGARPRGLSGAVGAAVLCVALLVVGGARAGAAAETAAPRCKAQSRQVLKPKDVDIAERSLLCLVNVHRAENDQPVLTADPSLDASAREHSRDMVSEHFYDHVNPITHEDPTARAQRHGYRGTVGENIYELPLASGVSPVHFYAGWASRGDNNATMLDPEYVAVGTGFALGTHTEGEAGATVTQVYGTKRAHSTYTALDMLVPAECPPAREALKDAKAELAAARDAGTGVAKAERLVKKRRKAVARACSPTHF